MQTVRVKFYLNYPYKVTILTLFDLVSIWGFRVISSSTRRPLVVAEMSGDMFRRIFAEEPRAGQLEVPAIPELKAAFAAIVVESAAKAARSERRQGRR